MKKLFVILLVLFATKGFAQPMACRLLHNVPGSLRLIQDSAFKVANTDNLDGKCIIPLIDSLRDRFIKTHKTEYLDCLDSICFNCNEDVGERFVDTVLFYQSFKPYIDYLFTHGDTNNCLTINLVTGFGLDMMDDPNDLFYAKKRLDHFILEQERIYKFSDAEKRFIDLIKHYAEDIEDEE
jgi:hypothetical protein